MKNRAIVFAPLAFMIIFASPAFAQADPQAMAAGILPQGTPKPTTLEQKVLQENYVLQTLKMEQEQEQGIVQTDMQQVQAKQNELATLKKAPASDANKKQLSVLNVLLTQSLATEKADQQNLYNIEGWIRYWEGQAQTDQWNISQNQQDAADKYRAQVARQQRHAEHARTREGSAYWNVKNTPDIPYGPQFSDGWTSIPFRSVP